MTQTLDISEARRQFNSLDARMRDEGVQVIHVMRHSRPAFAVVDADYLEAVLDTLDILTDPDALKMLEDSLEDIRAGRVYDHEDVKREVV